MFPSVCAAVAALARAWITIGLPATAMACALPADPALATTAAELPARPISRAGRSRSTGRSPALSSIVLATGLPHRSSRAILA